MKVQSLKLTNQFYSEMSYSHNQSKADFLCIIQ